MKRGAELLIILIIPFMCGCLYGRVHPLAIEPAASYMGQGGYEILGDGEGMSSSFTLLGIFRVTPDVDTGKAVDEAVRSMGGDNLIEAVYYRETKVYVVGVIHIVRVKGKVIRYSGK